jgi:hypothetical protein
MKRSRQEKEKEKEMIEEKYVIIFEKHTTNIIEIIS